MDKYKHTQTGILTEELVAAALGVPELVVGDSIENTADEGQVYVGADIWTDNALFQVVNTPALQVAASAYTVMWNEKGNIPWAVESYREEGRRSFREESMSRFKKESGVDLGQKKHWSR